MAEKQEQLKEIEEKLEIAKKQLRFPQKEELKEKVVEQTRINIEMEYSLSKKLDTQSMDEDMNEAMLPEEEYNEENQIEI
ncbi:hypothetical protein ACTRH0_001376 [Enterococcus hirae]